MRRINNFLDPAAAGASLRRARRLLDATQWDLACRAGVSQAAIHRVERGIPVSDALMGRILAALAALEREARKAGR